jgi:hypothetical protein
MNCFTCKHCRTYKDDAHVACSKAWHPYKDKMPNLDLFGVENGWCFFPVNYDPIWIGKCEGHEPGESKRVDLSNIPELINIASNTTAMKIALKQTKEKKNY